jgi:hypothetical protein
LVDGHEFKAAMQQPARIINLFGATFMQRIPIVTSVPPRLSRTTTEGIDIGAHYQEHCIDSWMKAGFAPVSVNSVSESVPFTDKVQVIRVPRTAAARFGKPLVFISDLLRVASELSSGPIAITNADILIVPEFDLLDAIGALEPGQAVIARRIDITRPDDRDGVLFLHGYDFFAAHPHNLKQLPDLSLAVGIPWWDHFLPIALYATGVRVHLLTAPFLYHLNHEERWDNAHWCDTGVDYIKRMEAFLRRANPANEYSRFLANIVDELSVIEKPSLPLLVRQRLSPSHMARKMRKKTVSLLGKAATGTVNFIEERFSA